MVSLMMGSYVMGLATDLVTENGGAPIPLPRSVIELDKPLWSVLPDDGNWSVFRVDHGANRPLSVLLRDFSGADVVRTWNPLTGLLAVRWNKSFLPRNDIGVEVDAVVLAVCV